MIQISIDEATAYDMASAFSVQSQTNPAARPDWDRLIVEIARQVGPDRHEHVMQTLYPVLWALNQAASIATDVETLKDIEEQHAAALGQLRKHFQS